MLLEASWTFIARRAALHRGARWARTDCCRFRSATRATSRSRCIPTGTISGRCEGCGDAAELARALGREAASAERWEALAARLRAVAVRLDRGDPRRAHARLHSRQHRVGGLRSDGDCECDLSARCSRGARSSGASSEPSTRISPTGAQSAAAPLDSPNYTPVRDPHHRRLGAPRTTRRGSGAAAVLSRRIGARRRGINGRRSRGAIARRPRIWAIFRTPGLPPNTCSRCAACSPTSARPTAALVLGGGSRARMDRGRRRRGDAMPHALRSAQLLAAPDGCAHAAILRSAADRRAHHPAAAARGAAAQRR